MKKDKYLLEEMTWPEAKKQFSESDIALLPVGSIEQHGHHLPLSTDAFDAYWLAGEVVKGIEKPRPAVLPPLYYGIAYHHMSFAGSISLSPETLIALVYEIGTSLTVHGVKKLIIVNGHGGNTPALKCAAQKLAYDKNLKVFIDSGETAGKERQMLVTTKEDAHSGEYETSTSLANREELVDINKAVKNVPQYSSPYLAKSAANNIAWVFKTEDLSESGVLGDPTLASKEKGEKLWQAHISNLREFIEQLKNI